MKKKVIWISSYLPRSCGIAYYSADYISALKEYAKKNKIDLTVKIISHTDATEADYPVINLKSKVWGDKVFQIVKKEKPDIVHIQHEYGLYESYEDNNERVLELVKMIIDEKIPVVMTFHSVYKKLELNQAYFMSESLKDLNAGIVHEEYQKKALKKNIGWIPENVYVLPHGSKEDIKIDKDKIREGYTYTKDDLVVGSMGIASDRKGFLELIEQWPKVLKKFPKAILVIDTKPHKAKDTREYIKKVLKKIMDSSVSENIEFVVEDYKIMEFYKRVKSFDILVLAYESESQSGVLAHGFAVGTPSIVTDIEGLGAEIRNSNAGIAVKNRNKFYKAIIKLLSSKKLREKYSRNALNYVHKKIGWSIIARKTFGIYNQVIKENNRIKIKKE